MMDYQEFKNQEFKNQELKISIQFNNPYETLCFSDGSIQYICSTRSGELLIGCDGLGIEPTDIRSVSYRIKQLDTNSLESFISLLQNFDNLHTFRINSPYEDDINDLQKLYLNILIELYERLDREAYETEIEAYVDRPINIKNLFFSL